MSLLCSGVLVWALVHSIPVFTPNLRASVIDRIGAGGYKGLYVLGMMSSLALIVMGWKVGSTEMLYDLGISSVYTVLLMLFVVLLFIGSMMPTNIKRVMRHPQLISMKLWAVSHLLINGTERDVILFGGLLAWAVIMMIGINKRDGAWVKPAKVSWKKDVILVIVSVVVFVILPRLHVYFAGVPLMQG